MLLKGRMKKILSYLLAASIMATSVFSNNFMFIEATASYKDVVDRISDPITMDQYNTILDLDQSSRKAGEIWADKTVIANGTVYKGSSDNGDAGRNFNKNVLTLNQSLDGVTRSIDIGDDDFLHVYSLLGSTQEIKESTNIPIDLVLLIDMSGSMGTDVVDKASHSYSSDTNRLRISHSRIAQTIDSMNKTIDYLMELNDVNRVAVVGYGGTAYTIMELGHYTPKTTGQYLKIENFSYYGTTTYNASGSAAYTITADVYKDGVNYKRSARNEYSNDSKFRTGIDAFVGYHTNLQAGIYQGFNELYKNAVSPDDVSYTYTSELTGESKTIARIPMAIVMTDGGSNFSLKKTTTANRSSIGDEWYDVPIVSNMTNYASSNRMVRSENDGLNGKAIILQILMTASYMKSLVQNKYTDLLRTAGVLKENQVSDFIINTVTVDTPTAAWQIPRIYTALYPKDYFMSSLNNVDWKQKQDSIDSYQLWMDWQNAVINKTGGISTTFSDSDGTVTVKFNTLPNGELNGVTNQDVINNINYSDNFYDIQFSKMEETFKGLIENVNSPIFSPVGGTNDLGVSDSVTYIDPIGKYMEVKDVKNLVLFGENHAVTKTAIYSYAFITKWNEIHGDESFKVGWYSSDDASKASYMGAAADSGNWNDGNVYYLNGETAREFVSTLDENRLTPKQEKTLYTFYRITDLNSDERSLLRKNPVYGTDAPKEGEQGVYRLNDIRIWVEDTGDYNDSLIDDSGIETNVSYDEALFINIPQSAIPLRIVRISQDEDKNILYSSNVNSGSSGKYQDLPLRVFYTVGVTDELIQDGNINLANVSRQYLEKYQSDGKVSFISNWYSEQTYDEYVTTGNRTRGDAAITFSADVDNRYYIFQKPLTLYKAPAAGANEEVVIPNEEELQNFISSHETVTDHVDSESYYWVIGEYFREVGENNGAKTYVAATRKGAEFGSGVGDHTSAAYLVWYNETTEDLSEYSVTDQNQGKPSVNPEQWVVATRPGGLRLGDMAQNIVSKSNNTTGTSNNVLLPTVSTTTDSYNPNSLVVNYYLGNNGLLKIDDSMLLVTKDVLTDRSIGKPDDKFEFTIHIDGKNGIVEAIKCVWDGDAYDALTTDYVLTDNNGYILFANGTASGFLLSGIGEEDRLIMDGCVTLASGEKLNVIQYDESGEPVYQITFIFDTQDVEFDSENNAEIYLGHGEALLFMGLHTGTTFSIYENELTKEQEDKGFSRAYAFSLDHEQVDSMLLSGTIGMEEVREAHFVNQYDPHVNVSLKGKKTVKTEDEYELSEGDFKFILTPSPENPDGDPITEAAVLENGPDGIIQIFDNAEYTKIGDYYYTLHEEINEGLSGIIWDDSVYEITVAIKTDDDDPSVLTSDISVLKNGEPYEEKITFENQYVTDKTSVVIGGKKVLDNAIIKDYSFTFKIEPVSAEPLSEEESILRQLMQIREPESILDEEYLRSHNVATPSNYVETEADNTIISYIDVATPSNYVETSLDDEEDILAIGLENIPMPEDGKDTVGSTSTGEFQFGKIVFSEEGVYTYQITEEASDITGMVYDTTTYEVVVTVKKDADGMLQASMHLIGDSQAANSLLFENIYTIQSIEFSPKVKKIIAGNPPASGKELFIFELTTSERYIPGAYLPSNTTATVRGDGEASFDPITITKEGSYVFVIREKAGARAGYQYDESEWTVTVETELDPDEDTPTLRIKSVEYTCNNPEVTASEEFATFRNIYTTTQTTKQLEVEKVLTGEPTPDDKTFTFTLSAREGNPEGATLPAVNQKTIAGAGTVKFDQIVFTKTGTFWFDIKEGAGSAPGYDYDSASWSIEVVIEDNDSKLQVSKITYFKDGEEQSDEKAVFTNNYHVTPANYTPSVTKQITGERYPNDKTFEFTIRRLDEKPGVIMNDLETITIDGIGQKSFGGIQFTKAGTYMFEISESEGTEKGYTYDTVPYTLTVVVEDKDSVLTVRSHTYAKNDNSKTSTESAVFVNNYSVEPIFYTPKVRKSIIGAVTPVDKEFTFHITTEESIYDIAMPSDTSTKISGEGTAEFGSILFKRSGTYTFVITEDEGSDNGYAYSDDIWTLTVEVEDNDGILEIKKVSYILGEQESEEEAIFTNIYSVTETSLRIPVEKKYHRSETPCGKDL